jgi:hypothetical protein
MPDQVRSARPAHAAAAPLWMLLVLATFAGVTLASGAVLAQGAEPVASTAPAATETPPARPALRGPDLGFPGAGRVLLGFLLCAGLALGATILLRRYLPGATLLKGTPGFDIRVLGRARVETSLRVHVVEASGARVLIAEGRNGVSAVVLPGGAALPPSSGAAPIGSGVPSASGLVPPSG